ncbi:MAG TPA: EamA family transporter, partial [Intrasporangium sp.]|nr:EamA family transporter [Intrasporangium sp.]
LLSRHPVASVTPFAMLVPVFGMAAAALAFGERPTLLEVLGGLVLLAGVATAVLRRRPRPNRPRTQSREPPLRTSDQRARPGASAQPGSPST